MVNNGDGNAGGQIKKTGCICSKDNFLPEESFQSWGSYLKALGSTKFARSFNDVELKVMRARSHNKTKKTLNWWDLLFFELGILAAGIFVLGRQLEMMPAQQLLYLI